MRRRSRRDAVVIGAGPAGGLAAVLLARAGLDVLLVERRSFPRYKVCGACVNPAALSSLRAAGLEEAVRSLPGEDLSRVRFVLRDRDLSLPLPGGRAVARDRFDQSLADAALRAGAEFLPETSGVVLPELDREGRRRVQLGPRRADAFEISAGVVLAADGLGQSSLKRLPGFGSRIEKDSRIGLGTTVPSASADFLPGVITLAVSAPGYVGFVRTGEDELNVAAALDAEFVRSWGRPGAAVDEAMRLAGLPALGELEGSAWHGTGPLTRRASAVAGARLFVLGDSSGYVEPFTGEGIAWALGAATAVAPLAVSGAARWRLELEAAWTSRCGELIRRRQRWCRTIAAVVRRPWAARSMMSLAAWSPAIAGALVERISGPAVSAAADSSCACPSPRSQQ